MTTTTRTCAGCDADLTGTDGRRRWCSERCRKRTLYSGTCVDCGAPTSGSNGKAKAPTRCNRCERTKYAERNERIFAAWEAGETAPEIAAREGMTARAVSSVVGKARERYGRPLPLHRKPNRTDWSAIERGVRAGLTNAEIAASLGCEPFNVAAATENMRKAGIELPPRSRARHDDTIISMYREGRKLREIAAATGLSGTAYISQRVRMLRKRGVELPRRRAA